MNYFINLSTHNHRYWGERQIEEALKYGEIIDIFPTEITLDMSNSDIIFQATKTVNRILKKYQSDENEVSVMIQANYVYSFYVVSLLKEKGIRCLAAHGVRCERDYNPSENITMTEKKFEFVKFIEY